MLFIFEKRKEFLLSEIRRFFIEEGRNPKQLDFVISNRGGYPDYMEYRNTFNIDWSEILKLAGLYTDAKTKTKTSRIETFNINCEICGIEAVVTREDRKICDSNKCRYVRDMLLIVKHNKRKYKFSIFHYVPDEELKEYYKKLYDLKKKNISMLGVV